MANREWMYMGFASKSEEWIRGTNYFVNQAFGPAAKGSIRMPCPCRDCKNSKRKVKSDVFKDLYKNGFVANYKRWIFHGEDGRITQEEVRECLEEFDGDAGMADMVVDYNEARGYEGLVEEDPKETAKVFYEMMSLAQKPLHEKTRMSQLDAIGRLIALKSQLSLSRDGFDHMLAVFGEMLPKGHVLPKNTYESQKLLRALKMPYESVHACPKGKTLRKQRTVQSAKPLGMWR